MNKRTLLTCLVCFCLSASLVFAQPVVTQADLLNLVNGNGIWETSGSGIIPIDLKQTGPDQVWDFRNLEMGDPIEFELRINESEESPYAGLYPTSDHVLTNILVNDPRYIIYSYLSIMENRLQIVSRVIDNAGDKNYSHTHPDYYIPLPLTYGTAWQSIETDTADWGDQGIFIYKVYYDNIVDAYGTVKLPAGDVESLRLRTLCTDVSNPPDTIRYIEYTWIARNNIYVAKAVGPYNDPNPDFTEAEYFERFKSIQLPACVSCGSTEIPSDYMLKDNYPNPFNPTTSIEYAIPRSEYVRLDIYNISGQRIRTLQADFQLPGQYKAMWNGIDESGRLVASGIYICRLKTQSMILSKRMLLLK